MYNLFDSIVNKVVTAFWCVFVNATNIKYIEIFYYQKCVSVNI